jgi:hypothetical protein
VSEAINTDTLKAEAKRFRFRAIRQADDTLDDGKYHNRCTIPLSRFSRRFRHSSPNPRPRIQLYHLP